MRLNLFLGTLIVIFSHTASSQRNVYVDHNKLIQNKAQGGGYYLIGIYKVQGSPYCYPDLMAGSFYSKNETALNISLRYDLYFQNLEFISSSNKNQVLVKEPGEIDSFVLYKNEKRRIKEDLHFHYATIIGASDKNYYQVLYKGVHYSLYKRFSTELIIPLAKAGMGEMREFETKIDYWYVNESSQTLKPAGNTVSAVKKEFSDTKDLSPVLKAGNMIKKPDEAMIKAFAYLNE